MENGDLKSTVRRVGISARNMVDMGHQITKEGSLKRVFSITRFSLLGFSACAGFCHINFLLSPGAACSETRQKSQGLSSA